MADEKLPQRYKNPFSYFAPWFQEEWFPSLKAEPSGLSLSEDAANVYVEAAVPGIKPEDVEITYDNGLLWIKGQKSEEEKDKQRSYYRKASSTFSYHLTVPGNIDDKKEPEADYKDGILTITFKKSKEKEPKKIKVKRS